MLSAPGDWDYFSEGGKHVVFTCRHLALRIEKSSLARLAATFVQEEASLRSRQTSDPYELVEVGDAHSSHEGFRRLVVGPYIGSCYIDVPRNVLLPAAFCLCLYNKAVSSGKIPQSRLPSWQTNIDENVADPKESSCITATLLRNHIRLKCHQLPTSVQKEDITVLSVEIKPKAGYLASSPLILPAHRCKWYHSRYYLQQELMKKGIVKRGWHKERNQDAEDTASNRHMFRRSNYSPLDLFSGDSNRIKSALEDLSKNMQNNFRVWCDGVQVFGEYDNLTADEYKDMLHAIIGKQHCSMPISDARLITLDLINHVVAGVIHREKLLQNLLRLQRLDEIDADGAVQIYKRLLDLCSGSECEAETVLERHYIGSLDDSCREQLLSSSPFRMPQCPHLHELLNEIHQFEHHLQNQRQGRLAVDESIADRYYSSCNHHVQKLSKEACIYLLSNWLLSLTMCDVSFFVTFELVPQKESIGIPNECNQSGDSGGSFVCTFDKLPVSSVVINYELKLIDFDPKPVKKIRSRHDIEKLFKFCRTRDNGVSD